MAKATESHDTDTLTGFDAPVLHRREGRNSRAEERGSSGEIHTRRAVVFEHLFANEALRTSGPSSFEKLAYDRRQTAFLIQRSHRALMEHARHPTAPPPPVPLPTEQPGWFLYNPVGKQLVEAMYIPAFHDRIRAQHRDGQRLLRDRDALVRRIRSLRAEHQVR